MTGEKMGLEKIDHTDTRAIPKKTPMIA